MWGAICPLVLNVHYVYALQVLLTAMTSCYFECLLNINTRLYRLCVP